MYKTDKNLELGCDWIRMRKRYEVYNSAGKLDEIANAARDMSYLSMLGKLDGAETINKLLNYNLNL